MHHSFEIKFATINDIPLILSFIKELAEYEKMSHEVTATETLLCQNLFGEKAHAEVIIGYFDNEPIAFALFFQSFSTFLGKSGIYLEDLFVKPNVRGQGIGKKMLSHLAKLAQERKCGRLEWSVLNWNKPAIDFYKSLGAKAMDEWTIYRVTGHVLEALARQAN